MEGQIENDNQSQMSQSSKRVLKKKLEQVNIKQPLECSNTFGDIHINSQKGCKAQDEQDKEYETNQLDKQQEIDRLGKKPFNVSQQSFRSTLLSEDSQQQMASSFRKPQKLNPLQKINHSKRNDDSTLMSLNQMNSDYQQFTSVMQDDYQELPEDQEHNRQQIVKLNNFFDEMQKQKNKKIEELQNFIDKFDSEIDKSVLMNQQRKEMQRLDFVLVQKEDELKSLMNKSRSQLFVDDNQSLQTGMQQSATSFKEQNSLFVTNVNKKNIPPVNKQFKYNKLQKLNINKNNDQLIKKPSEQTQEKTVEQKTTNKNKFIEKNKKVDLGHRKDQLIELDEEIEDQIQEILNKDYNEDSNPFEIDDPERLKQIEEKIQIFQTENKTLPLNNLVDMTQYKVTEDELNLKEKTLRDLKEKKMHKMKLEKINERLKEVNCKEYQVDKDTLDKLMQQLEVKREGGMEHDRLWREERELVQSLEKKVEEVQRMNQVQQQLYEELTQLDINQCYQEYQQEQLQQIHQAQNVINHLSTQLQHMQTVITHFDDKNEKMGLLVENVLDKQQKMLDLNDQFQRNKYDESNIRALQRKILTINYEEDIQPTEEMLEEDKKIEEIVKQQNKYLYEQEEEQQEEHSNQLEQQQGQQNNQENKDKDQNDEEQKEEDLKQEQ